MTNAVQARCAKHGGLLLWLRPGYSDVEEVKNVRAYAELDVGPDDCVLDLGAHVGVATATFAAAGARVMAVEPEPRNFRVLNLNAAAYQFRVETMQAAVVARGALPVPPVVEFYPSTSRNQARGTLEPTRGRAPIQVPAVTLNGLLMTGWIGGIEGPGYSVLKVDVEGAEFDILPGTDLSGIRAIAMEVHLMRPAWRAKLPALLDYLRDEGFRATKDVDHYREVTYGWPFTAVWIR